MKMFDYSELIRVIDNVEIREEKERVDGILKLKEKYAELERTLVASGIFDDWNRLKQLCKKANVRLCVSHLGDNSIGYALGVGDFRYCDIYADNGTIQECVSAGSYWSDYYGFVYESDRGVVWQVRSSAGHRHFNGFGEGQEPEKYLIRIRLLETFRDTYEHYREFQLKQIEKKFENRIKAADLIK